MYICLGVAQKLSLIEEGTIGRTFDSFSFACNDHNFFMAINDIALFSINNREKVIIELLNDSTIQEALPFFYGTVLTVLLHMHFKFPIHASAVLSKSGLNLFCAASGTGKSTLAFNLFKRGYPLFSDDKCILKWDRILKKYISEPSIRAVRLWQDAMDSMNNPEELINGIPVLAKEDKYQYNMDEVMYDKPHIVNRIYIIRKVEGLDKITIWKLVKKEKINALKAQIHRPGLVIGEDIKKRFNLFINNLASQIPVFFVRRPVNITVHDFVDFMERHMNRTVKKKKI